MAPALHTDRDSTFHRDALLVLAAAFFGRLPALGAWWNQDDWGLLARAAGLLADSGPARLVSRDLYWRLLYPVCGLDTAPWAVSRILLHALAALLVLRLARRAGAGQPASLAAGLLFAATPLAFTPLYWASGVQELLGAVFALAAVDCFLSARRGALVAALAAGALTILSKESALLLPLWLGAIAWFGDPARRRGRLPVVLLLLVLAAWEAAQVLVEFAHGAGAPFALAAPLGVPLNLTQYGWWLITPGPRFASGYSLAVGLGGLAVWVLWAFRARQRWRQGVRWPLAALLAALLSLAPTLLLRSHLAPYLAYLAAAPLTLTLADALCGRRTRVRPAVAVLMAVLSTGVSWGFMASRTAARDDAGLPADPLVRRTAVAHETLARLHDLPVGEAKIVVFYQPDGFLDRSQRAFTARGLAAPTLLHRALGGTLGPALAGPAGVDYRWAVELDRVHLDAVVLADTGAVPLYWGPTTQAYLYQALTDIAQDRLPEAARHLHTGLSHAEPTVPFVFNEVQLPVDAAQLAAHAAEFLEFIPVSRVPDADKAQLAGIARDLLTRCGAL